MERRQSLATQAATPDASQVLHPATEIVSILSSMSYPYEILIMKEPSAQTTIYPASEDSFSRRVYCIPAEPLKVGILGFSMGGFAVANAFGLELRRPWHDPLFIANELSSSSVSQQCPVTGILIVYAYIYIYIHVSNIHIDMDIH